MSFLTAGFITLLLGCAAFYFFWRFLLKRDLALQAILGGTVAILVVLCLIFSTIFYVCVEYVYNRGPDDWGVMGYARAEVDKKFEASWSTVRILDYKPGFMRAYYQLSYQLADGKHGMVYCHVEYPSGRLTSADIEPEK